MSEALLTTTTMKNRKHKWGVLNLFLVPNVHMVNGSNKLMLMGTYDEAMRQLFIIYDGAMISRVSTEIAEAFNKKICDESKTKCLFYSHHHEFSHPALNKDIVLFMGNTSLKF